MKGLPEKAILPSLGERLRAIRKERGLTQEALAQPEYTKGYVSALERGAVRPSLKALDVFARRLNMGITEFLEVSPKAHASVNHEVESLGDTLHYQCNYVRMLIRSGKIDEAFRLLEEAEERFGLYQEDSPVLHMLYQIPYLRGLAYIHQSDPRSALPELERALSLSTRGMQENENIVISRVAFSVGVKTTASKNLETAEVSEQTATVRGPGADNGAVVQVRNMMGLAYYLMEQPQLALEQHLQCLRSLEAGSVKDVNLGFSVYSNLANDYRALNNLSQATSMYQKALPMVRDLPDLESQARNCWSIAQTYGMADEWLQARLYATKALHIYESVDSLAEAASIYLDLSEILVSERRYDDVPKMLEHAERLLAGTGKRYIMSYLHRSYAELAHKQGRLEEANQHAKQSSELALVYYETMQTAGEGENVSNNHFNRNPARIYADALQMEALIEEEATNREAADYLFQKALALLPQEGFEVTKHAINLSYAKVLEARGEIANAVSFYRVAAELQPYAMQKRTELSRYFESY